MRSSTVGQRLKWARERAGWTVRDLAQRAGLASSSITDIELDTRTPKTDTVERLAVALKVERCWLAYGDGKAPEGWQSEERSSATEEAHIDDR